VIGPGDEIEDFYLGAHAPNLSDEEIEFIHKLWLDVSHERGLENVRHKEIVTAAVVRLADELHGNRRRQVLDFLRVLRRVEKAQAPDKHLPAEIKGKPEEAEKIEIPADKA
jgi:hypothetical protein